MINELKPVRCGCGGEAYIKNHTFHRATPLYRICCEKCGMTTPPMSIIDNAIEVWNGAMGERTVKVEDTWKIAGYDEINAWCPECEHRITRGCSYCPTCGVKLEWK